MQKFKTSVIKKYFIILIGLLLTALCAVGYSDWVISGNEPISPLLKIPVYVNSLVEFDYESYQSGVKLKENVIENGKQKTISDIPTKLKFINYKKTEVAISLSINSQDNNNISFSDSGTITIGNTYEIKGASIALNDSEYYLAGTYSQNGANIELNPFQQGQQRFNLLVKYQTVQVGTGSVNTSAISSFTPVSDSNSNSQWYTIEDALTNATDTNNIIKICANTSFTNLEDRVSGYSDSGRTIKNHVSLVLPYDGTNVNATNRVIVNSALSVSKAIKEFEENASLKETIEKDKTLKASKDKFKELKRLELYVPVNMSILNNGSILIGGETTGGGSDSTVSGATTGPYCQITLGENAIIRSNGNINAYGYIIEANLNNGSQVIMQSGGTFLMPFIVVEHRGGSIFYGAKGGAFGKLSGAPFNRFSFQNITSKLIINSGAMLQGWANLYANSQDNTTAINFIGDTNSYLLKLGTNSRAELKCDLGILVNLVKKADGKYEKIEVREKPSIDWNIYGNATINSMSLTINVLGFDVPLDTKEVLFPISWYWNITLNPLNKGETATVTSNQDMKIMPGACLTIAEGVTFEINKLFVYDLANYEDLWQTAHHKYSRDNIFYNTGGQLLVGGTLNVTAITGRIDAIGNNARLNISSSEIVTSKELLKSEGSNISTKVEWTTYPTAEYNITLRGPSYDPNEPDSSNFELTPLTNKSYLSQNNGWLLSNAELKKIIYNYNGGSGEKESKTILLDRDNSGNIIPHVIDDSDLITTPIFTHYQFKGWYIDPEFNTLAKGQSMTSDITLYAHWEADAYDIVYKFYEVSEEGAHEFSAEEISALEINNESNKQKYSYMEYITFVSPSYKEINDKGLTFIGWFTSQSFDVSIDALEIGTFGTVTLYGKWTKETPKDYNIEIISGNDGVIIQNANIILKGTEESGANGKISVNASIDGTNYAHLDNSFMNSDDLLEIISEKHYSFSSCFIGWTLRYKLNEEYVLIDVNDANPNPNIIIPANASEISLTARWASKTIVEFKFFDNDTNREIKNSTTIYFKHGFELENNIISTLIDAVAKIEFYDYKRFTQSGATASTNSLIFDGDNATISTYFKQWFVVKHDTRLKVEGNVKTDTDNNTRVSTKETQISFSLNNSEKYYIESISANGVAMTDKTLNLKNLDSSEEIVITAQIKNVVKITLNMDAKAEYKTTYFFTTNTINGSFSIGYLSFDANTLYATEIGEWKKATSSTAETITSFYVLEGATFYVHINDITLEDKRKTKTFNHTFAFANGNSLSSGLNGPSFSGNSTISYSHSENTSTCRVTVASQNENIEWSGTTSYSE